MHHEHANMAGGGRQRDGRVLRRHSAPRAGVRGRGRGPVGVSGGGGGSRGGSGVVIGGRRGGGRRVGGGGVGRMHGNRMAVEAVPVEAMLPDLGLSLRLFRIVPATRWALRAYAAAAVAFVVLVTSAALWRVGAAHSDVVNGAMVAVGVDGDWPMLLAELVVQADAAVVTDAAASAAASGISGIGVGLPARVALVAEQVAGESSVTGDCAASLAFVSQAGVDATMVADGLVALVDVGRTAVSEGGGGDDDGCSVSTRMCEGDYDVTVFLVPPGAQLLATVQCARAIEVVVGTPVSAADVNAADAAATPGSLMPLTVATDDVEALRVFPTVRLSFVTGAVADRYVGALVVGVILAVIISALGYAISRPAVIHLLCFAVGVFQRFYPRAFIAAVPLVGLVAALFALNPLNGAHAGALEGVGIPCVIVVFLDVLVALRWRTAAGRVGMRYERREHPFERGLPGDTDVDDESAWGRRDSQRGGDGGRGGRRPQEELGGSVSASNRVAAAASNVPTEEAAFEALHEAKCDECVSEVYNDAIGIGEDAERTPISGGSGEPNLAFCTICYCHLPFTNTLNCCNQNVCDGCVIASLVHQMEYVVEVKPTASPPPARPEAVGTPTDGVIVEGPAEELEDVEGDDEHPFPTKDSAPALTRAGSMVRPGFSPAQLDSLKRVNVSKGVVKVTMTSRDMKVQSFKHPTLTKGMARAVLQRTATGTIPCPFCSEPTKVTPTGSYEARAYPVTPQGDRRGTAMSPAARGASFEMLASKMLPFGWHEAKSSEKKDSTSTSHSCSSLVHELSQSFLVSDADDAADDNDAMDSVMLAAGEPNRSGSHKVPGHSGLRRITGPVLEDVGAISSPDQVQFSPSDILKKDMFICETGRGEMGQVTLGGSGSNVSLSRSGASSLVSVASTDDTGRKSGKNVVPALARPDWASMDGVAATEEGASSEAQGDGRSPRHGSVGAKS